MKNYIIIILLLLPFIQLSGKTTISAKIVEKRVNKGKVYLEVNKEYLVGFHSFYASNFSKSLDSSGEFRFEVDDPADVYYIDIYFEDEQGRRLGLFRGGNLLLVQRNSIINLEITGSGLFFGKTNAPLIQYQATLATIWPKGRSEGSMNKEAFDFSIDALKLCLDRLDSVSKNHTEIPCDIRQQLAFNYKCYHIKALMNSISWKAYNRKNGTLQNVYAEEALKKMRINMPSNLWSDKTRLLYNYIDLCYLYNINSLQIERKFFVKGSDRLLLERIKKSYRGYLLEQLLLTFYLDYSRKYNSVAYLEGDGILKEIKDVDLIRVVKKSKNNSGKGAKVYPFIFKDTLGHDITSESLKGNVLLVEFWFNGCQPCIYLSRALKDILATYEGKEKIKQVTVNVDKDFSTFVAGVRTGDYTSPKTLDLHIGPDGYQHEMLIKYNYYGFPQLMLIDRDGNLVSAFVPKPTDDEKRKEFIQLLNSHL
ncbi:TlpA family protein disulfide reductase [Sphingobacterium multivorum]|uniref:TlpA family protein disulfide reductase n=1 Tax=Sphingobacterium multivorum TaxID=28454 RepID=UPI0028AFEF12|nr:thioredoxin-like domain-containing protein [Sphingobacterium multivorum]